MWPGQLREQEPRRSRHRPGHGRSPDRPGPWRPAPDHAATARSRASRRGRKRGPLPWRGRASPEQVGLATADAPGPSRLRPPWWARSAAGPPPLDRLKGEPPYLEPQRSRLPVGAGRPQVAPLRAGPRPPECSAGGQRQAAGPGWALSVWTESVGAEPSWKATRWPALPAALPIGPCCLHRPPEQTSLAGWRRASELAWRSGAGWPPTWAAELLASVLTVSVPRVSAPGASWPVFWAWEPGLSATGPESVAPGPPATEPALPLPAGRGWPRQVAEWPGCRAGRPAGPAGGRRAAPRRPRGHGGGLQAALPRRGRAANYLPRVPSASRSPPAFLMISITCTTAP